MTTNKKKWEPLFFSGVGIAAMGLILVGLGVIAGVAKVRMDLTADKLYTLSDGSRKILGKLDTKVTIHFYCTQSENEMPVMLKNYARRVEDLLSEYRQASGGNIEIQKFDPQPDSDAEDLARIDGVEGQSLSQGGLVGLGEKVFLGLAVTCLDQKTALPFLDPNRERLLEYDLTRAISQVVRTEKPNLALMSGLPVFGQPGNPMMARMGQKGQDPWVFVTELKRDFNVKQIEMTAEKIDDDVHVLVVVHPSNISEKTQFALDQFVLRGGKLVAFLDPLSSVDAANAMGAQNMLQRAASGGSTLDKLLKAWGLEFDINKVVADQTYRTMLMRGETPSPEPTWLSLTSEGIDQTDVVTSQIDSILLPFPGAFTGTPATGLKQTVLLKSSANSQLVDKMMAQFGGAGKDFTPSGKQYSLALRLVGKFKTAFPDGKPESKPADKADAKDKPADKKDDSLKESKTDGVVILVGDTDLLYDNYAVQIQNFFGQKLISPRNGNLNLLQNMVEQLMGDNNLIGVRSRSVQNRPFTLVKQKQAQAEENYRAKIKELEQKLTDAQQKINSLQTTKDKNQRFVLSPEQQEEVKKFHREEAQVKKDLKELRKQLRKDIDSLETRLKWINIAGMPFLVTAAGISLAIFKRKKTAAK